MIKKCTEKDRNLLNNYLYKQKELNLFAIGDIQNFGFDNENMCLWMDIDQTIEAVYLRFFTNLLVISYSKKIDNSFINVLIEKYSIENINGEKSVMNLIENPNFMKKDCYFSSLDKFLINIDTQGVSSIEEEDLDEYFNSCEKIFKVRNNRNSSLAELKNNTKHIVVYKENSKIVSSASSCAECNGLAMLVSVFTLDEYRRKGYAIKTVYKLCEDLLKQNKTVCLFYDNPNAAKMYEKIGFKFVGYFTMLKLKK